MWIGQDTAVTEVGFLFEGEDEHNRSKRSFTRNIYYYFDLCLVIVDQDVTSLGMCTTGHIQHYYIFVQSLIINNFKKQNYFRIT